MGLGACALVEADEHAEPFIIASGSGECDDSERVSGAESGVGVGEGDGFGDGDGGRIAGMSDADGSVSRIPNERQVGLV